MARTVHVDLVDDLDGSQADETLAFAVDGKNFEIDLSTKHAKKLRSSLERYVKSARKVGRGGRVLSGTRARTAGSTQADRAQNQAIRDWAKRQGIQLSDRGRIPGTIVAQYEARAGR